MLRPPTSTSPAKSALGSAAWEPSPPVVRQLAPTRAIVTRRRRPTLRIPIHELGVRGWCGRDGGVDMGRSFRSRAAPRCRTRGTMYFYKEVEILSRVSHVVTVNNRDTRKGAGLMSTIQEQARAL